MFLLLIILIMIILYWYGTKNFDYWRKRNIPFEKPMIFLGSMLQQYNQNVSESERFHRLYRSYPNEKCVGFFELNNPVLLVRDPVMIKHIMVVDFKHFHHRGRNAVKDTVEPLLRNLFFADGDSWKLLRQKLSPAFSRSKLKAMFPLITERAERLSKIAESFADKYDEVDIKDLMARYTTDFIGACGFGIDADALNNESSEFREFGKRIFAVSTRDIIVITLKRLAPHTFKHLNFLASDIEDKLVSLVKRIMSERNYKPSGRNDFIDVMLALRQSQKIVGESIEKFNPDNTPKTVEIVVDDILIAAQVFIFFAAGFETSSFTSSMLLHNLAHHPEVQSRCQKEIDEVLAKYDGKLCFDAVWDMKYLEMAFKESFRVTPSPGFLLRRCVKKYTFPETNLSIDEGVSIFISTEGLNSDERYFENPSEFRPERFHPDNIGKIDKFVFMPFGCGPRNCIGERMGIMQSLAGVATILSKFTVVPSCNSLRKPLIHPHSAIVQNIKGGLPLHLKRRN